MTGILSSREQLEQIAAALQAYARFPYTPGKIPGEVLENVLADARDATRSGTYDFVDVYESIAGCGWQVKSTRADTPVTWMRAKIEGSVDLIPASEESPEARQELGDRIIALSNAHVVKSFKKYSLQEIGYARLIIRPDNTAVYFERPLVTRDNPLLFNPEEFSWEWSLAKEKGKKEQLQALHGTHLPTDTKWFAWHGRGENQLHFTGERTWWPDPHDPAAIAFRLPEEEEKLSVKDVADLLGRLPEVPSTKPL